MSQMKSLDFSAWHWEPDTFSFTDTTTVCCYCNQVHSRVRCAKTSSFMCDILSDVSVNKVA